jgi:hypothetical protein
MRPGGVAAGVALVLAADVAVVRDRSRPEPAPLPVVGIDPATAERAGYTRRRVHGSEADVDPCRPDVLLARETATPAAYDVWSHVGDEDFTFVTARVRRWPAEQGAEKAFGLLRRALTACAGYEATTAVRTTLTFSYDVVDDVDGLGDEAVRVVSSGGFAGSGEVSRWEGQHVVRVGAYLLDVRVVEIGPHDGARPDPCWAEAFVDGLHGRGPGSCLPDV